MSHGFHSRLRIRKGCLASLGWQSNIIQPTGKFEKRIANRKVRYSDDVLSNAFYRRLYGPMEWC